MATYASKTNKILPNNLVIDTIVSNSSDVHKKRLGARDFDKIFDAIGDATVVLIGEASHGTSEFYQQRCEITKKLIEKKGFNIIAVESDWPDALRVNRFCRNYQINPNKKPNINKGYEEEENDEEMKEDEKNKNDENANQALGDYKRYPRWMWRNEVVCDFVDWLQKYNNNLYSSSTFNLGAENEQKIFSTTRRPVGFFGIDLYSLHSSQEAVIEFLKKTDPDLAEEAIKKYSCFEKISGTKSGSGTEYGLGIQSKGSPLWGASTILNKGKKTCENEVIQVLVDLHKNAGKYVEKFKDEDSVFFAEQNALVVKNAEEYYRKMFDRDDETWNIRDSHMCETIKNLMEHFNQTRPNKMDPAKIVVWAHNSHLGDARFTESRRSKEWNVGQLCREKFGMDKVFNIGFTTYTGTVTASKNWGDNPEFYKVNHGLPDSYEHLFHEVSQNLLHQFHTTKREGITGDFYLIFRSLSDKFKVNKDLLEMLSSKQRLERAIGVIYRPDTERWSHYFECNITKQFDAIIHIDRTNALIPLEKGPQWLKGQQNDIPETYPYSV